MPFDRPLFLKELSRKSIHASGFFLPLLYYFFIPRDLMLIALGLGVVAAGILELVRLSGHNIFPGILLRTHEERGVPGGYFFAITSTFVAVLLFEKTIAVAAILFLDLGDALTGLAGVVLSMYRGRSTVDARTYCISTRKSLFRHILHDLNYALVNHKSPYLMAIMFMVCSAIGLVFYPGLALPVIIAGAIGAVLADAFPWCILGFTVDDNLSIPLVSGAMMTLAAYAI